MSNPYPRIFAFPSGRQVRFELHNGGTRNPRVVVVDIEQPTPTLQTCCGGRCRPAKPMVRNEQPGDCVADG